MNTLFGMPVYVDPSLDNWPKFQLSPEFAAMMPPEWVSQTNQWCREFFGTESKAIVVNRALLVGPKALEAMKRKSAAEIGRKKGEGNAAI